VEAGVYSHQCLILHIWVNNILLIGDKVDVGLAPNELKKELNIKELGAIKDGTFLRIIIRRDREEKKISRSRQVYKEDIGEIWDGRGERDTHIDRECRKVQKKESK